MYNNLKTAVAKF